jgi:general secretion pathway protein G
MTTRRHTTTRGSRGFTLVELVVVMMIISILAGAIAVAVTNRVKMARRARAISDIKSLETALDLYEADNGKPPTTEQGLEALRVKPTTPPVPRNWNGPYLTKRVPLDPWGHEYVYRYPGQYNENEYDLICYGADGQPGGQDWDEDITNHD